MAQIDKKKRGNKSLDDPVDFISHLPRGVIDAIMDRLHLRDAARMSILSRKWHEIWTSIQKLAFDALFFSRVLKENLHNTHEFSCIVSKILFHHEGNLLRFYLYIPPLNSCPDVNQWICYLSRTGVSEISIHNLYQVPLKLGSHIFSCSNLEKLKLHSFIINPPRDFEGFRKMTCLELDNITLSEKSFKHLVNSCPLLQRLRLTSFTGMEHIIIDAPYLRWLVVDGNFTSLDVRNAANLVSALFGLPKWVEVCHKASLRVLIQGLASSFKLQQLVFRGYFCKVLYKKSLLPTTFEKLRTIDLSFIYLNDADDFYSIISVLKSCPSIEWLYISVTTSKHTSYHQIDYNPSFLLHSLCYTDVKICSGSCMELKLIEILLACSPILKKVSITSNGDMKKIFQPKMMIQLIRFRRASQNVEVVCPDLVDPVYSDSISEYSSYSSSDDSDSD